MQMANQNAEDNPELMEAWEAHIAMVCSLHTLGNTRTSFVLVLRC